MYQNDPEKTGIFLTDNQDFFSEIEEWNPNLKLTFSFNDQLGCIPKKSDITFKYVVPPLGGSFKIQGYLRNVSKITSLFIILSCSACF